MTASTPPARTWIYSFEGARGLCALLIAWAHFGVVVLNIRFFTRPALAVEFFFVLSGFVLAKVYANSITEGRIGLGSYAGRRFFRLYPLHLFCLLLLTLFYGLVTVLAHGQSTGTWSLAGFPMLADGRNYADGYLYTWVINALFVQGIGLNRTDATWVYTSWSVSAEFFVCLLLYPVYRLPHRAWRLAFGIALTLLAYGILLTHTPDLGRHSHNLYGVLSLGLLRTLGGFFLGVLLYELSIHLPSVRKHFVWKSLLEAGLLIGFCWILIGVKTRYIDYLGVLLIAGLILLICEDRTPLARALAWRPLVFLGGLSYSIYLNHVLVIGLFLYFQWHEDLAQGLPSFLVLPATGALFLFLVTTLSLLTRQGIEVPARRACYHWINRRTRRRSASLS